MKRLVWLVILGGLVYFGYIHLIRPSSPEVARVRTLEREFRRSTDRYINSMRQAGEPGLVILADPETAEQMVKNVRLRLSELMTTLSDEKAIARARNLEDQIASFCRRHEID
jgi:hypothetical protein